ncbi:V-type proton ATPase subunit S1b [Scomber scombrus]|uniref:V-type proton ATPase subunit S1b n=1 Tax=Scomber scombrus TaxID=13677 RepID=UPI002DD85BA5|nr:V-type proton ATPase subunit S1b [Scomber scombrus]
MKMADSKRPSQVRLMAFLGFFFALFATGSSTAQVPLLMWPSEGFSLPPLGLSSAGHITSNDQLTAYLTSAFGHSPHTVLLFLQDKLSKDDFTVFGGAFGNKQDSAFQNLQAALQSSSSSVTLPALEWSGSSVIPALLQEKLGVSPLLVDADTLSQLSINTSVSNLLLINLPYCAGSQKSCKEVLHDNDEIIGKVLDIMKAKNVHYTAIYTGLQPSRVISETSMTNDGVGRSLLQTAAPTVKAPIVFSESGNPCIMLWAQNLSISITTAWIDLATETPTLTGSVCNDTNSLLVLNYPSGVILSFSLSQQFYPVSARNWSTLDTVQLRANGTTATFLGRRGIYSPAEYSFHCQSVTSFQDALLVPNNTLQNVTEWKLNFVDFQIQGFGLNNGTNFSYASDCASFFTPGIWMGLLTSLLMLYIFVYGLHMIMQLNTMDRFDDPKGPSISVPQTE